jgi:CheY-like chemotaxis protein
MDGGPFPAKRLHNLILMDVKCTPDGLDATRNPGRSRSGVRSNHRLTALAMPGTKTLPGGMNEYLSKPIGNTLWR